MGPTGVTCEPRRFRYPRASTPLHSFGACRTTGARARIGGYVVKGRLRVSYADGEETYAAGDLSYMAPGHTFLVEEDAELVEFSPPQQADEVGAVLRRNLAAAASAADRSVPDEE